MKRNKFNLSHYKLGSCDMGSLIPISCFEVLPGDTIQMHTSVFLRFAPMVAPVMHPIKVSTYSFFVPLRLLWDDWEDFITGGPDGLDTSVPPTYSYSTSGVQVGSVCDYLGVPIGYTGKISAFPIRAYHRIFDEYFRDQDLTSPTTTGSITTGGNTNYATGGGGTLLKVSWEKDYFTTSRPWPQKGATVTIPVQGDPGGQSSYSLSGSGNVYIDNPDGDTLGGANSIGIQGNTTDLKIPAKSHSTNTSGAPYYQLKVDGSSYTVNASTGPGGVGSVHLDDLREAFALQRFEEHRSMYGSRYTEYLRYLGVRARDSRLQRPEYLGGGKSTVQLSEVLQTAADGNTPVGTLRGHGIGLNRGRTFRRFVDEHGIVMTLMTIRPIAIYLNGLNKMWSREVKEDYWQRELEHIGQQEVLEKELYATGDTTSTINDNSVFGYNNRYDEYRSIPSSVCGEMRTTLDYWHMARSFSNAPVLNTSFITGAPTKRIFAEQTQNEIYFMASHSVVARRILSKMGNPIL